MKSQLKKSAIKLLVLWVVWPQLSYSFDYTFGVSNNAAAFGNTWSMTPKYLGANGVDGMEINGIIYQYTAVKDKDDDFTVTVQNEKEGGGYVFKDTEDWSQKYGMTIRKAFALPYTPLATFKEDGGAIVTTGTGNVENAQVVYLHRFNRCFDPQSDPNCTGYVTPLPPKPPKFDLYDALDDEFVEEATKETDQELIDKDDEEVEESEEKEEEEENLQTLLAVGENPLTMGEEFSQSSIIAQMNAALDISSYYKARIPSIVYNERLVMKQQKSLGNSKRILRSLAQDQLHNQMVEAQYQ